MKKRIICFILGLIMSITPNITAFATTMTEIVQQNNQSSVDVNQQNQEAQNQLLQTKDTIEALSEQQASLQAQISDAYADIVDLMIVISASETDIANTEACIWTKQDEINAMSLQVQAAEADLGKQYNTTKARIRYLYEKDWSAVWFEVIFSAKDFTTFLNRADYAKQVHDYDRNQLMEYAKKVSETTAIKNRMETEKAELERQKALLEAQKAELDIRKQELQLQLTALQAENIDFVSQITTARAQAAEIISLMNMQNTELQNMVGVNPESITNDDWWQPIDAEIFMPGGSSGAAIVTFAEQFIGYPYVWGGNSLTNGIDCSHFVFQVLKHCGLYDGPYVTSAFWREKGEPVASLEEAKAGDIICYLGHVAIYDGNGGIVEARGSKWGITHNRAADFTTILAIRRFAKE